MLGVFLILLSYLCNFCIRILAPAPLRALENLVTKFQEANVKSQHIASSRRRMWLSERLEFLSLIFYSERFFLLCQLFFLLKKEK
jgi:hypothetical protein